MALPLINQYIVELDPQFGVTGVQCYAFVTWPSISRLIHRRCVNWSAGGMVGPTIRHEQTANLVVVIGFPPVSRCLPFLSCPPHQQQQQQQHGNVYE